MPKKVADHSVVVYREDDKTKVKGAVAVPPNTAFDFTEEEIEDILRHQPDSLRDPVNEDPAPAEKPAKAPKASKTEGGSGPEL